MLIVNYLVVFIVTFPVVIHGQLYSGDHCILASTRGQGVCKTLSDCPAVLENLRKNQQHPQTCGFQGSEPIICCPDASARIAGEMSKKKCKQYSRNSREILRQPITTGSPEIETDECGHKVVKLTPGNEPAGRKEFPHQAAIGFEGTTGNIIWLCGGTLISERFILTAAHCLSSQEFGAAKYVRMGITNLKDYGSHNQQIKITQRIVHPKYRFRSHYYDIGLVKLETNAVISSFSRPACLYTNQEITTNKSLATGWGRTIHSGAASDDDDLLKVTFDFFSQQQCNTSYRNQISRKLSNGIIEDTQICAGSFYNTCQSDSGGPLQIYHTGDDIYCMYDIVGIASFGIACNGIPGVYTRVSYFIKWIEDLVWPQ